MKLRRPEILYSDHVREIISRPPARIVRWGTTVIFSVFILILILSWVIRYPDIIPAPVEITTVNPPAPLTSRVSGRINKLYVTDGQKVSSGQILAVMETAASIREVEMLSEFTDTINGSEILSALVFPEFSELGELQIFYATCLKYLSDYNTYITNDFYGSKMNSITDEIKGLTEYIDRMKVKERVVSDNLAIERKKYERDSILFADMVISESDLEKSKQSYNQINLELQQSALDRAAKIIELAERRQLYHDYRITREEERMKLQSLLDEAFMNLTAQIRIWQNKYLLISPFDGKVTFTQFWSENQSVDEGEQVLNVVPENTGDLVGRILLNMQRSGKVKTGQAVNIKLSGFPYLEFGMVRGTVKTKSLVPAGNAYVIEVSLENGLRTLYGKELEFTQNMQGSAEILTDDLRLLQKIINPFRHLISKNKI